MKDFFIKYWNLLSNYIHKIFYFFLKNPIILLLLLTVSIIILISQNQFFQASLYFGLFIFYFSFYLFFRKQLKYDKQPELDIYEMIFKFAGVFAICSLAITYIIGILGKYIVPSSLHFGSIDSWIQFSGSILSGTLTIFALAFTLNQQEKNRKSDLEKQENEKKENELKKIEELEYRNPPILKLLVNIRDRKEEFGMISKDFHIYSFKNSIFPTNIEFELKNISTTSVAKVTLLSIQVSKFDPFRNGFMNEEIYYELSDVVNKENVNIQIEEYELLPSQTSIYFSIEYHLNKELIAEIDEFPSNFIKCNLKFQYTSTLLKKVYILESIFSFSINRINNDLFNIRIDNPKNIYKLPKLIDKA